MKIKFENFGNVKKGEIELKPLTAFIGSNNTGKTYCTYSIYGLFHESFFVNYMAGLDVGLLENMLLGNEENNDIAIIKPKIEFFKKYVSEFENKQQVKIDIIQIIDDYLDKIFDKLCNEFLENFIHDFLSTSKRNLFNNSKIKIEITSDEKEKIKESIIKLPYYMQSGTVKIVKEERSSELIIIPEIKDDEDLKNLRMLIKSHILEASIVRVFMELLYNAMNMKGFVLPSERLALVSLYDYIYSKYSTADKNSLKEIISEIVKSMMSKSPMYYNYPQPISDFIEFIEDVKKGAYRKEYEKNMKLVMERNKYIELSELIEKEVFSGKIRLKKGVDMSDYVMEYEFDENKSIEMHLTSSMVKELTGLVLYFKYLAVDNRLLIIDEPEMNLHPEAQVKLLEILTMAVNRGLKIIITTHSPYITDQLTNLMECYIVKDKIKDGDLKKYIFTGQKEAIISSEKVGVYFFGEDGIIKDILNREDTLIDWETFSKVSERLGVIYDDLLDLEFEDKERGEEHANE